MDIQQKCLFQSTEGFRVEETAKDRTPLRVETFIIKQKQIQQTKSSSRMNETNEKVIYYVIVQRSIVQLCTSEIVGNIIIIFI